jgi:hypothetical protein
MGKRRKGKKNRRNIGKGGCHKEVDNSRGSRMSRVNKL